MIWAIASPRSWFSWLYRASPSLATKNIINLISILTIWWCPCVESSLVLLEECVCYDQCVLLAKLCYPLPCFTLYSKAKLACYSRYLSTSYFSILIPSDEKDIFFLVLVLKGLVGLHRTTWYPNKNWTIRKDAGSKCWGGSQYMYIVGWQNRRENVI